MNRQLEFLRAGCTRVHGLVGCVAVAVALASTAAAQDEALCDQLADESSDGDRTCGYFASKFVSAQSSYAFPADVILTWKGSEGTPSTVEVVGPDGESRFEDWPDGAEQDLVVGDLQVGQTYTFIARDLEGSALGTQTQQLIDTPPMKYSNCSGGSPCVQIECFASSSPGDCEIIVVGGTSGPPPTVWDVFLDGEYVTTSCTYGSECSDLGVDEEELIPGFDFYFCASVPVREGGEHTITTRGVVTRSGAMAGWDDLNYLCGAYIGGFVETRCESSCEAAPVFFMRGLCTDNLPTPSINSAIAIFNYLFIGGATPECLEACDVDDNSEIELTDGVALLNFLFLGSGIAPATWIDQDGDSRPDPTCQRAVAGEDCSATPAQCGGV